MRTNYNHTEETNNLRILRQMRLHEKIEIEPGIEVMRVFSGWLYTITKNDKMTTTFVHELR